jgi:hypothetical protein
MKIIFDLDDQSDSHNAWPLVLQLKDKLPNLKVNLFTIPNQIKGELVQEMASKRWVHLIPHGFNHWSNYEFAEIDYKETMEYLLKIPLRQLYRKGFKAPGWQISKAAMLALKEQGYWLATQWSDGRFEGDVNGPFQPAVSPGLPYYAINELLPGFKAIHGHTWNVCGNGIEELWPMLVNLPPDSEFEFIDDYVRKEQMLRV